MTCICCCRPAGACCRESSPGSQFFICDQRDECACRDAGGFYYGPGRTCASVNCSSATQRCLACCDPSPATIDAAISISGDFLVGNSYFAPGGGTRQYFGLSSGSLTQNVTLTRGAGDCRTYSFSGGCTAFGKFRDLSISISQGTSLSSTQCVWGAQFSASFLECALSNLLVSQINPCTGEANLFAPLSGSASTQLRPGVGCLSGAVFSNSSTAVFSCTPRFFPNQLECYYAPTPSQCPAVSSPTSGTTTIPTSLQWSISVL